MKRRPAWLDRPARNVFAMMPPSQALIAKAHAAGVTPLTIPNIREWQRSEINEGGRD